MSNTIGSIYKITSFGESHGESIGVVIDGLPSNFEINLSDIQKELDRRKPGYNELSSPRKEADEFKIISGLFNGKTTGAPLCIIIPNTNTASHDYENLKEIFRPGHADMVYTKKYTNRDYLGGGRSSARITAAWVAAGAIAKQFLTQLYQIKIESIITSIYNLQLKKPYSNYQWENAGSNEIQCPDKDLANKMATLIRETAEIGDTLGGTIAVRAINCPIGLGEPVFNKLNAAIAHAMFSINAVKGVEIGGGFESAQYLGSNFNSTATNPNNYEGGITAGISNGNAIEVNVAFKPVSSIKIPQSTYDINNNITDVKIKGRHDVCVIPRALPIVEAMLAIVLFDHSLLCNATKLNYDTNMTQNSFNNSSNNSINNI